jgi:hypothetical protein
LAGAHVAPPREPPTSGRKFRVPPHTYVYLLIVTDVSFIVKASGLAAHENRNNFDKRTNIELGMNTENTSWRAAKIKMYVAGKFSWLKQPEVD